MKDINIFALGGQDENGKNAYVFEFDNDIYMVNAGIKVPIGKSNGVDGIIAEFEYLKERKDRVKGVFITHAHDEVFAAIPWLLMEVPGITIYASAYTRKLIEERVSKYKIGHSNFKFETIKDGQVIGKVKVKTFEIANNIPGSLAYSFETPKGDIMIMSNTTVGDMNNFGKTDLEEIKKNSNNILALLLDSRTSNKKGSSFDKKSPIDGIKAVFEQANDDERIIVGAYDEEVYATHEVIKMAKEYGRPVISYGRAFDGMYEPIRNKEQDSMPKFLDYKKCNETKNAVILVTGTWSRLYKRFERISGDNDVFLKLRKSDTVFMITPPINGMEVEYSNTMDLVARIAPNVIDVSDFDFYKLRPAEADIQNIVKTLKPKYFVPISSLYRYLVNSNQIAAKNGVNVDNAVLMMNGKVLHFQGDNIVSRKGFVKETGDVIIDGFGAGDVSYEVIKERQTLAAGGLIAIAVQMHRKTKKPVGEINVQVVGVAVKQELSSIQEEVNAVVLQKIADNKESLRELQNTIRKRVRKVISKKYDKEPLVVITFYDVQ